MDAKTIFTSKTFWVNLLALVYLFIGPAIGSPELSPTIEVGVLSLVNIILRLITKQPIEWPGGTK